MTIEQNFQRKLTPITVPVLAVGGVYGLGEGVGVTMRLGAHDVTTMLIDGCGHYPAEENPDAITEAILNFCFPGHATAPA